MKKHHHPQCASVDSERQSEMKQQLRADIHRLERQLNALQHSSEAADFELVNSYKMMLHHRTAMLTEINGVSPLRM